MLKTRKIMLGGQQKPKETGASSARRTKTMKTDIIPLDVAKKWVRGAGIETGCLWSRSNC